MDADDTNNDARQVSPSPAPRIKREMHWYSDDEEDAVMQDEAQEEEQQDSSELASEQQQQNDEDQQEGDEQQGEQQQQVADDDYQIAESDYTEANKIPFASLCNILELLFNKKLNAKKDRNKWSNETKLDKLLPKSLLKRLKGGDPYPFLRLVVPETDTKRPNTGMQEKTIAKSYETALGLAKESSDAEKLTKYADPTKAKVGAGDLSRVVEDVIAERYPKRPSRTTVGQINNLLDELVDIKTGTYTGPRNHEWRDKDKGDSQKEKSEKPGNAQLRAEWVSRLLDIPLSPLEHKWIVRILLQKVEIGIGRNQILNYLSPYSRQLYDSNNSLKRMLQTLSDPEWIRRRKERAAKEALEREQTKWDKYMPRPAAAARLCSTISPMLAIRATFETTMSLIEEKHRKHAKRLSEEDNEESNEFAQSLALKFPTLICEVKLDGERMLIHVNRGVVTMQTRNTKWYSNVYGPVLAPGVRKAIAPHDVDVVLDCEIIAWDDGRQEVIPFGSNRTVANDRRKYLFRNGLVEDRDLNHHKGEQDFSVVNPNEYDKQYSTPGDSRDIGAQCWLKCIVFDILYVGGPDAARLISESTTLSEEDAPTGSILNLSGFDRKKILYRLITPQANVVELMPSLVVRRNGQSENAATYFSPTSPSMESGLPCSTMDSVERLVNGDIPDWEAKDKQARGSKSDEEIGELRVGGMDKFYVEIVENQGLEGLIFKDLLAPYYLGGGSRSSKCWIKMKPDYATDGHSASDIDGVVIGAYYATGMGKAGILNAFLIGCVDEKNPGHFMTLCKVNGGSVAKDKLVGILEYTGFKKEEDGDAKYGKWFRETNHGKEIPDFISERSLQSGSETDTGWTCQAKKYPDLWIHPDDSFCVALNCGEVTQSDEFSAGVSLRFPRITEVRIDGIDDAKPVNEAATCEGLVDLFRQMDDRRKDASLSFEAGSSGSSGTTRFLTTEENNKRKKAKPKKGAKAQVAGVPVVESKKSAALAGVTFVVAEGIYSLDEKSLDAEEAKVEGWFEEAAKVKKRSDVQEYISRHGGTCKLAISSDTDVVIGGLVNDARVEAWTRTLNSDAVPGKKDAAMTRLLELGGVVKWTYVYSSVRRWIDEGWQVKAEDIGEGPLSRQQIALGGPPTIVNTELARPARHDYLVLGKRAVVDEQGDVFGIQLWKKDINIFDLKRGLEEVEKSKLNEIEEDHSDENKRLKLMRELSNANNDNAVVPWQYATIESLQARDRWVVVNEIENLWNFRLPSAATGDAGPIVIYPDLFDDGLGLKESDDVLEEVLSAVPSARWEELSEEAQMSSLSSSLPLARTMGAQVTPHLHKGVTHVLCCLKGRETAFWQPDSFDPALLEDEARGARLHHRLLDLHGEEEEPVVVKFVSPDWVRAQFDGTVVV